MIIRKWNQRWSDEQMEQPYLPVRIPFLGETDDLPVDGFSKPLT